MRSLLLLFGTVLPFSDGMAQEEVYTTCYEPYSITYNSSDRPGVCMESVDFGVLVYVGSRRLFFTLPAKTYFELLPLVSDQDVRLEVIYYDALSSGIMAAGSVVKITFRDTVVFSQN